LLKSVATAGGGTHALACGMSREEFLFNLNFIFFECEIVVHQRNHSFMWHCMDSIKSYFKIQCNCLIGNYPGEKFSKYLYD